LRDNSFQFVNMISETASYLLPSAKKDAVMKWFSDQIDKNAKPLTDLPRREVVLFPPGKCIHFYRDGVGISAVSSYVTVIRNVRHVSIDLSHDES
jgi:hypothetical protein